MKKQFSPRRNYSSIAGRSNANGLLVTMWSFGGVVVLAVLIMLCRFFIPTVLVAIASPVWKEGNALDAGVGSAFAGLGNATKLSQENTALAQQIVTLQNENAVLTARAQDLTKLLGGVGSVDESSVGGGSTMLAGVLARPPLSPYDTIIVGSGSDAGVSVGAEAFAAGGIPIGTVTSVTKTTATIQLLSTAGVVTNGWVGSGRVPLTLTGMGAGAFTAALPSAAPVSVGDSVYVPGPGAIPLGTITKIDTNPSSPTVVLHVQSLVNIFSLTWIEISSTQ